VYVCSFALFVWLISHQPAVLFSHNKPATSNQPSVLFSQNKSAPAISRQPNEQAESSRVCSVVVSASAGYVPITTFFLNDIAVLLLLFFLKKELSVYSFVFSLSFDNFILSLLKIQNVKYPHVNLLAWVRSRVILVLVHHEASRPPCRPSVSFLPHLSFSPAPNNTLLLRKRKISPTPTLPSIRGVLEELAPTPSPAGVKTQSFRSPSTVFGAFSAPAQPQD
jgi:hypothetical protein